MRLRRLRLLEDLPNEILVKIINFLPNHDVRCGISLACKKFQEICQDESLVPVKDLSIYGYHYWSGGNPQRYEVRSKSIEAMSDIIVRSQNLTSLKVKAWVSSGYLIHGFPKYYSYYESADKLVSIALQNCPKLIHLEFVAGEYF